MTKGATITDVAKAAGVSITTVSRVINGNPKVEKELADRVRKAIEELKYTPNIYARGIKGMGRKTIGIVIPSSFDNFFSRVLEGVLRGADDFDLNVIVFSCHGDASREIDCLKSAVSSGISGLLHCPSSHFAAQQLHSIFPKDFPITIVYRRDMVNGIPHIYHDNIKGGYLSTKYLLRQGHREIAFFAGFWQSPSDTPEGLLELLEDPGRGVYSSIDRLDGHIRALEESGIPFDKSLLYTTGYDFESGYKRAKEFLSTMRDFDSVICGNDSVAAGVLQALREQKISVPDQVSIIGYDDSVFATIARPQLTSVRQRPIQLGYSSVEMIVEIMKGKKVENRIIDVQLTIRDSTSMKHNNRTQRSI